MHRGSLACSRRSRCSMLSANRTAIRADGGVPPILPRPARSAVGRDETPAARAEAAHSAAPGSAPPQAGAGELQGHRGRLGHPGGTPGPGDATGVLTGSGVSRATGCSAHRLSLVGPKLEAGQKPRKPWSSIILAVWGRLSQVIVSLPGLLLETEVRLPTVTQV